MLKWLVFDWDGTLADSASSIIRCKQDLAKKYHLSLPSPITVKSVLGKGFDLAMKTCFPDAEPNLLNSLKKEYHQQIASGIYPVKLFEGVSEVIHALQQDGYKLAIATAKAEQELKKDPSYQALSYLFQEVCCAGNFKEKPAPDMLDYILKKYELTPNSILMIGDTVTDLEMAKNAGVKAVAVTYGAHTKNELNAATPIGLINNIKALIPFIAAWDK